MSQQTEVARGNDVVGGLTKHSDAYEDALAPVQALVEWSYQCSSELKLRGEFQTLLMWISCVKAAYDNANLLLQTSERVKQDVLNAANDLPAFPPSDATNTLTRVEMTVEERDSLIKREQEIRAGIQDATSRSRIIAESFVSRWDTIRPQYEQSFDKWYVATLTEIGKYASKFRKMILQEVREKNAGAAGAIKEDRQFDEKFYPEVSRTLPPLMSRQMVRIFEELRLLLSLMEDYRSQLKLKTAAIDVSIEQLFADIQNLDKKMDVAELYSPLVALRYSVSPRIVEFISTFCYQVEKLFHFEYAIDQ